MTRLGGLAWLLATAAVVFGEVGPVAPGMERHSIHTYFNVPPESPDGRWVLFYTSTTPEGHNGEVRIRERATGKEIVLAHNVTTEDAHRAACQQWASGGRTVVFHDVRDDVWTVVAVDVATRKERILARGRQLAWGQPDSDIVPIYGPHWAPGPHRDLELLNVRTGEIRTAVTAAAVRQAYPEAVGKEFGDKPISVFFPILSPNLQRVAFKLATPMGGHYRSTSASHRQMLIVYDLKKSRFLFARAKWGHAAWHPDSRTMINVPNALIDSDTGAERTIPGLPAFPGSHPTISPDGRHFATDTRAESFGGAKGEWAVVVGDLVGHEYRFLRRFDNSKGAKSWRVSHPHPSFSADGKRVYFNVSDGPWTQLYVADTGDGKAVRTSQR